VVVFCCVARRGYPFAFRDGRVRFLPREWSWRTLSGIIERSVRVLLEKKQLVQMDERGACSGDDFPRDQDWSSQKREWLTPVSRAVVNYAEEAVQ